MARASSIDRLPAALREAIAELRRQGRTIDEILAHLKTLGAGVSRSALARHTKSIDEAAEMIGQSRAAAEALVARLEGRLGDDRLARLNVELLQSVLHRLVLAGAGGEDLAFDARDVKFLAEALQRLASAGKTSIEEARLLRGEVAERTKAQAAEAATAVAARRGLSPEVLEDIKAGIFGVKG